MTSSAVVVSYRPGTWLGPCLASVAGQFDEVVLMDNGSEGAEASTVGRKMGARVFRSEVNRGFAPAVNVGASAARGDILALLNDDAVAGPDWLATATRLLSQPTVAAVGPKIVLAQAYREVALDDGPWQVEGDPRTLGRQLRSVTVDGRQVLADAVGPGLHRLEGGPDGPWRWTAGRAPWYVPLASGAGAGDVTILVDGEPAPPGRVVKLVNSAGTFLDTRGYGGDIGADCADDGGFDHQAERFGLSGCALVTRMGTWRSLGPFAAPFFAYYEDIDWCWRAQLGGMKVIYDPSATVVHHRSASSGGKRQPGVRVMAERNRTLSMVRNGPRPLVARALADRAKQGPDGGVRSGVARLLPWAMSTRAALSRYWSLRPEEVWSAWAGTNAPPPE